MFQLIVVDWILESIQIKQDLVYLNSYVATVWRETMVLGKFGELSAKLP